MPISCSKAGSSRIASKVRVPLRHGAEALPRLDRLPEVLERFGRAAGDWPFERVDWAERA